jgi:hypothetical protein
MHASLCDFLSDIFQNAVESTADTIRVEIEERENILSFLIMDNGKGMSKTVQKRVTDPFYTDGVKHVKRKVGLGLPFLIQAVESVGGTFSLTSEEGKGTVVRYSFVLNHIDCPPMGDVASTLLSMIAFPGTYRLTIERSLTIADRSDRYTVDRMELEELLGSFSDVGALQLLRTYLQSQEAALDEIRN